MAEQDMKEPGRVVQALGTPQAVVTYRAVVGLFITIILALVGIIGNDMRSTQQDIRQQLGKTTDTLGSIQITIATLSGRADEQGSRIGRNEVTIQKMSETTGSLDTRVTVLEHKGSRYDRN